MAALDLVFGAAPHGSPLELVFGAEGEAPTHPRVDLRLVVQLPAPVLQASVRVATVTTLSAQVALPAQSVDALAALSYDNRVQRWLDQRCAAPQQPALQARRPLRAAWQTAAPARRAAVLPWRVAAANGRALALVAEVATPAVTAARSAWTLAERTRRAATVAQQVADAITQRRRASWQVAAGLGLSTTALHQVATALRRDLASDWQVALPRVRVVSAPIGAVVRHSARTARVPWQVARQAPPGRSVLPEVLPEVPPTGPVELLFQCPPVGAPLVLLFGRSCNAGPAAAIVVPVRSLYMTHNNVTITRLSSGAAFDASRFDLRIDADSWTFSWSASLHSSARMHLTRAEPGEHITVVCSVNGVLLHLVVEQIGRDRSFPEERVSVRGRGLSAELGDVDLSFGNTAARTAQQLAGDVLTLNGEPFGWSVDWQITDWLVPAGAWVFQGSYAAALGDIAAAAGAYLQPSLASPVVRVLPRYPAAPWNWATALTPDIELPAAVAAVEAVEDVIKPAYNRVYVGGVSQGVFGPVTRAGTAGDLVAPQVAHALITAAEVHQQRGSAELAAGGVKERLTLRTLVLSETGIVMPGKVLRYAGDDGTRLGIVRSTQVQMNQWPALHQTLEVETHVE